MTITTTYTSESLEEAKCLDLMMNALVTANIAAYRGNDGIFGSLTVVADSRKFTLPPPPAKDVQVHNHAACNCDSGNKYLASECHNRGSIGCIYAARGIDIDEMREEIEQQYQELCGKAQMGGAATLDDLADVASNIAKMMQVLDDLATAVIRMQYAPDRERPQAGTEE